MNRPNSLCRAAIALATGLLGSSCAPDHPTEAVESQLAAHAPAHAVSPNDAVAAAVPDYTSLDGASARGTNGSLHLAVDAGGEIPRFPDSFIRSVAVFGYAWVDLATGAGVVAVIHPVIGRDSRQNPNGWHTHTVRLAAGTTSSSFCIASLGTSQGGISIVGDALNLAMAARQAGTSASALDVAASFIVQADAGCTSGLGVQVLDTAAL